MDKGCATMWAVVLRCLATWSLNALMIPPESIFYLCTDVLAAIDSPAQVSLEWPMPLRCGLWVLDSQANRTRHKCLLCNPRWEIAWDAKVWVGCSYCQNKEIFKTKKYWNKWNSMIWRPCTTACLHKVLFRVMLNIHNYYTHYKQSYLSNLQITTGKVYVPTHPGIMSSVFPSPN